MFKALRRSKSSHAHQGAGGGAPGAARSARPLPAWARRRRRRRGERGVALIMVLGTLTVLTVMLTEFQDETSAELGSAVAARDAVHAEYAARSGLNLTRLLIAAEPTIRQSVAPLFLMMRQGPPQIPVWEYSDLILGAFSDETGGEAFQGLSGLNLAEGRNLGMAGAGFTVQVVDEDSKININLAGRAGAFYQQRLAQQLLSLFGGAQNDALFDGLDADGNVADRATICSAIIDWTDSDMDVNGCNPYAETATTTPPEDSFYQLLARPYQRKNAAFDSLEEAHQVRGISDALWDRFFEPDPDDPTARTVTVWGQGAINVNTANPQTLLAVVCSNAQQGTPICTTDIQQQALFIQVLQMMKGMTAGVPVFGSKKAFVQAVKGQGPVGAMLTPMGFQPVQLLSEKQLEDSVSVESKVFSIYSTGTVKSGNKITRRRIHAVVDMRDAPPPGTTLHGQAAQAGMADPSQLQAGASATDSTLPSTMDPTAGIASAFMPSPGGTIIYYRVD